MRLSGYCLSKMELTQTELKGRVEKGMLDFDASKMTNDNIAALCAYGEFRWPRSSVCSMKIP